MKLLFLKLIICFTAVSSFGQTHSSTGLIRNAENIYDFFHHSQSQTEKLLQILKIDTAQVDRYIDLNISDRHHQLTIKNFLIIKEILNLNIMQAIIQAYYDRSVIDYYEKLKFKLNQKQFYIKLSSEEAIALFEELQLMLLSIQAFKNITKKQHEPKFHYTYQIEQYIENPHYKLIYAVLFTATATASYLVASDIALNNTALWVPKIAFTISMATYFSFKALEEVRQYSKSKKLQTILNSVDRSKMIPKNTIKNLKVEIENLILSIKNQPKHQKPLFCNKLFF